MAHRVFRDDDDASWVDIEPQLYMGYMRYCDKRLSMRALSALYAHVCGDGNEEKETRRLLSLCIRRVYIENSNVVKILKIFSSILQVYPRSIEKTTGR